MGSRLCFRVRVGVKDRVMVGMVLGLVVVPLSVQWRCMGGRIKKKKQEFF